MTCGATWPITSHFVRGSIAFASRLKAAEGRMTAAITHALRSEGIPGQFPAAEATRYLNTIAHALSHVLAIT